jgi:hypothetical protein
MGIEPKVKYSHSRQPCQEMGRVKKHVFFFTVSIRQFVIDRSILHKRVGAH